MLIRAGFEIGLSCPASVPLVMALSPHTSMVSMTHGKDGVSVDQRHVLPHYVDSFGNRVTRHHCAAGQTVLTSDFIVEVADLADRQRPEARQHDVSDLPDSAITYLLPSRYCDSDALQDEAWRLFGNGPTGWARVQAISDFVHSHVTFGYQFGRADKTASDVYREKSGVCRDFAHLSIAFCRAMNIPARYASGYLGDIDWPATGPGDFCAWFEAYLDGAWHTFDARYNAPRVGRILMVRGPDAAQVAMITSFGAYSMTSFRVWTDGMPDMSESDMGRVLAMLPSVESAPPVA